MAVKIPCCAILKLVCDGRSTSPSIHGCVYIHNYVYIYTGYNVVIPKFNDNNYHIRQSMYYIIIPCSMVHEASFFKAHDCGIIVAIIQAKGQAVHIVTRRIIAVSYPADTRQ